MKPAQFNYHRPATLEQALALLAAHGDAAKIISGGQSLVPVMNMRLAAPAELIDLNGLPGLAGIEERDGCIEAGALTRHAQLAGSALVRRCCPLLASAVQTIGHYAIRQRGTLGGSLAYADPAAQLPLIAVTLNAEIDIASVRGTRMVRAADFFLSLMTTALAADELVIAARFPTAVQGEGSAFRLFSRRRGDFAIVAAAATITVRNRCIVGMRIGVGGAGPVPLAHTGLCQSSTDQPADASRIRALAEAVRDAVEPADDPRISAQYRRELVHVLTERALLSALEHAKGSS